MFSFCLAHGLFGFIFLSVSSACSVFVSSSYPSHPRAPCSFHLVSETKRISAPAPCERKTAEPISRCLGGYFNSGNVGGSYGLSLKAATVLSNSSVTAFR